MNTFLSSATVSPQHSEIEQRGTCVFRGAKKAFSATRGERYLNLKLTADDRMAAFAITQVVLDEATLFQYCRRSRIFSVGGWGRMLLEHLIDELEKRGGCNALWLEVRASNAAAIALYESLGFNEGRRFAAITIPRHKGMRTPSSWRYR